MSRFARQRLEDAHLPQHRKAKEMNVHSSALLESNLSLNKSSPRSEQDFVLGKKKTNKPTNRKQTKTPKLKTKGVWLLGQGSSPLSPEWGRTPWGRTPSGATCTNLRHGVRADITAVLCRNWGNPSCLTTRGSNTAGRERPERGAALCARGAAALRSRRGYGASLRRTAVTHNVRPSIQHL